MNCDIVVGLGYGDEGKGAVVSTLTLKSIKNSETPLIIRYGGGHQCSHHIWVDDNTSFVHHLLGSGTIFGADTFLSEYVVVDPFTLYNEINEFSDIVDHPLQVYIDPRCKMTTPFDVAYNRAVAAKNSTVGMGFGATIERTEENFGLYWGDVTSLTVLERKIESINDYYVNKVKRNNLTTEYGNHLSNILNGNPISVFTDIITGVLNYIRVLPLEHFIFLNDYDRLIFEGHQGVLLDMEYGIFPDVTRSKTTPKNAMVLLNLIAHMNDGLGDINPYFVTRSYHTRHGKGYFPEKRIDVNNKYELNKTHEFQGGFKTAKLDIKLLALAIKYATTDLESSFTCEFYRPKLVMTCLDVCVPLQLQTLKSDISVLSGIELGSFIRTKSHKINSDFKVVDDSDFVEKLIPFEYVPDSNEPLDKSSNDCDSNSLVEDKHYKYEDDPYTGKAEDLIQEI